MEKRRMDAIVAPKISNLVEYLNREKVTKDDMVQILMTPKGNYIAVFYK